MNATFSKTLRAIRTKKGLSQQQLADMLFVDRSSVTNWEIGRRMPDRVMISRIANCLETDISSLIGTEEETGPKPVDDHQ